MNFEILIGFITATAVLAVAPGPDNIFVLTLSIAEGTKKGLTVVAGLMTGCLVHTSFVAFGVSALIKQSETLFFLIKVFGAIYLIYLAVLVYRGDSKIHLKKEHQPKKNNWSLFKKGFWMNVLNPKVSLFFLAFFPGFLFDDNLNTIVQFFILGLLFITVSSFVFGGIAFLAGGISKYIMKSSSLGVFMKWLQITVFLGIATYLLFG